MNREEEMALRELAAGRCAIQKVIDVLGPMSLWSKTGLEKEISNAVAAEREAIAKSLDKQADLACDGIDRKWAQEMAAAVRARGNT